MRTHMEVAGRMLGTYAQDLTFMPGLSELLARNGAAYIYGAAFPDWTHAAVTARQIAEYMRIF
ncbi:MAG: hypothetical protein ACJ8EN_05380, partial [Xanthobacteraceae bacterium]